LVVAAALVRPLCAAARFRVGALRSGVPEGAGVACSSITRIWAGRRPAPVPPFLTIGPGRTWATRRSGALPKPLLPRFLPTAHCPLRTRP